MTRLLFSAGVSGVVASPLPDFCAAIHCESLQFTGGRDARIPATRKDICVISNHHPVSFGEPLRYEIVTDPTREQQQLVADEIFAEIRKLYVELEVSAGD